MLSDVIMDTFTGAVVTVLGESGGGYAVRIAVGGADPYEVEVVIEPGPPKRSTLRAQGRLSRAQLSDYGARIGPIAAKVLRDHGHDPGPLLTIHDVCE